MIVFGDKNLGPVIAEVLLWKYGRDPELIYFKDQSFDDDYIIAFNDYPLRKKCVYLQKGDPFTVISYTAYKSQSAKIGKGCYIAANSTISTNVQIGDHCIINLNASIGHDAIIKDHCVILPGARISGNVIIEEGTTVGANAFIDSGLHIGRENMIDALAYVRRDLGPGRFSSGYDKSIKRL